MTHKNKEAARLIEILLVYGLQNEMIREDDITFHRNRLLDLLKVPEPYNRKNIRDEDIPKTPTPILEKLLDYCVEEGILPENTLAYRDLLDTEIMGIITPLPSQVIDRFENIKTLHGIEEATSDFYRLCQKSDYIRVSRISKNKKWEYEGEFGTLKITINLTKPEKDPKEIAALKNAPKVGYPKCLLCPSNVGYAGRLNHPARQTHRTLPLTLDGKRWYFQFSPYVYYEQHCIVLNEEHIPMKINRSTFKKLFEFLDLFPHYFIGSNADLPIVGGSILNHDHFQGGFYTLPMELAPIEYPIPLKDYPEIKAGVLNWPMSTIRLSSNDPQILIEISDTILRGWREYSDPYADILSHSIGEDGETISHNTITPIARRKTEDDYELDLVLRNNRTTKDYPLGIFHPHPEIHHIKKENIGLIEVMGLFILPGRLEKELSMIGEILKGNTPYVEEEMNTKNHPLYKHKEWIGELIDAHGTQNDDSKTESILKNAVGKKCEDVLKDAGVFKANPKGRQAFNRFLKSQGFELN